MKRTFKISGELLQATLDYIGTSSNAKITFIEATQLVKALQTVEEIKSESSAENVISSNESSSNGTNNA